MLVKNMVMAKVNIFEVKAKLSEYVERATAGERILICRHNTPVAELRAVETPRADERPVGPLPGRPAFELPPSFFEPLADEELDLWEGAYESPAGRSSRVAEQRATYSVKRGRRSGKRRS